MKSIEWKGMGGRNIFASGGQKQQRQWTQPTQTNCKNKTNSIGGWLRIAHIHFIQRRRMRPQHRGKREEMNGERRNILIKLTKLNWNYVGWCWPLIGMEWPLNMDCINYKFFHAKWIQYGISKQSPITIYNSKQQQSQWMMTMMVDGIYCAHFGTILSSHFHFPNFPWNYARLYPPKQSFLTGFWADHWGKKRNELTGMDGGGALLCHNSILWTNFFNFCTKFTDGKKLHDEMKI